ncbi:MULTISPECIES: acyltransferase family protein [Mammaliicoccus]|uniref:Probable poly-beta-1,6-N-acetyl-D-glucosamine export protein n=5 Tax=Mammaliicoccus sciuri TaxID=1296 RepID=A0AB37HN37_MAMSC|nr:MULTISPECIES: acyltransferase family protein [Mammaliicoccus]MCE4980142.1 acyltransferase family protein [Mammaliicoccus sciuri]MCE5084751.1 acyltransferase family protein [Mammaliicoccus sciuri]MCE5094561.1 acyltransferase family protein [Mammaliicoccus sciuri]MEB5757606.1 acyltransferase family protein [Mammaliicoccus sciuri]QQC96753.1 acyltransferase family protein [Mammaliicoccus sciuri]
MNRKHEITYARAIFCLIIVGVHILSRYLNDVELQDHNRMIVVTFQILILFGTPCFIILSESLISMVYKDKLPKNFLVKRFKYIMIPYFSIGTFYVYSKYKLGSNEESFWHLFKENLLIGDWDGWFVMAIFQFYILHLIFHKILSKANPIIMIVISFVISLTHSYLMYDNDAYSNWWNDFYPLFHRTNILYWLFYFVFGYYLGKYYNEVLSFMEKKLKWLVVSLVILALSIIYSIYQNDVTFVQSNRYDILIYSALVFIFILVISKKLANFNISFLFFIGEISFFIYLTHKIMLYYMAKYTFHFIDQFFMYNITTYIFALSLSVGLAVVLSFLPFSRFIIGRNSINSMIKGNYRAN